MPLIEWRDDFSLGVPSIDYEHRELIELINELHASLSREDADITVEDFLGEIYAKISAHFVLEEKMMREKSYDQYTEHKAARERLLDGIRDIMEDYEDEGYLNEEALAEHLRSWFTEHFKSMDARLHKRLH